jgi:hypothetical protein
MANARNKVYQPQKAYDVNGETFDMLASPNRYSYLGDMRAKLSEWEQRRRHVLNESVGEGNCGAPKPFLAKHAEEGR